MLLLAFYMLNLYFVYLFGKYQPVHLSVAIIIIFGIMILLSCIGIKLSKSFAKFIKQFAKKIFNGIKFFIKLIPKSYRKLRDSLKRKGFSYETASIIAIVILVLII